MSAAIIDSVPPGVLADILAAARQALPNECCGLLLGRSAADGDSAQRIDSFAPIRNAAATRGAFAVDPLDLARAEFEARQRSFRPVGYYHSHPHGAAVPSVADQRGTLWPELGPRHHLIVTPSGHWGLYEVAPGRWRRLGGGLHIGGVQPG